MLENNCQCDLCRSVWGGAGYMKNIELCADDEEWGFPAVGEPAHKEEQDKLTRIEAAILASFSAPYPSILTLTPAKVGVEALYENN